MMGIYRTRLEKDRPVVKVSYPLHSFSMLMASFTKAVAYGPESVISILTLFQ